MSSAGLASDSKRSQPTKINIVIVEMLGTAATGCFRRNPSIAYAHEERMVK